MYIDTYRWINAYKFINPSGLQQKFRSGPDGLDRRIVELVGSFCVWKQRNLDKKKAEKQRKWNPRGAQNDQHGAETVSKWA